MNVESYLKKLDKNGLENIITKATAMLLEKRKEEKYAMWVVSDKWTNLGWFKTDDYLKAAQFLLGEAKDTAEDADPSDIMDLHLEIKYIPMSEYKDWFPD